MRTDIRNYPSGATGGGGSGGQGTGEARGESAADMSHNHTSQNLSQKQRFDRLLGQFIVTEDCPNCGLLFTCGHRAHLRKCLDVSVSASATHAESAAMKAKGEVGTGGAVGTGGGAAGEGSTPKPPPTHLMAGGEFLHVGSSLKDSVRLDEGHGHEGQGSTHDPTSEFFLEQGITPWGHPAVPCSIGVTVSELHEENNDEAGGGAFSALPLSPSAPPSGTTTARSGTRTARSSGISLSLSSFRSLDAGGDGTATSRRDIATVMVKRLVACGHLSVMGHARPCLAKDLKPLTFIGAEDDRSEPKSALTDMELLHTVSSDPMPMPVFSGASTARAPGRNDTLAHSTPLQQRAALLYTQALAARTTSLSARDASNRAVPGNSLPGVGTGADVIVDKELFFAKCLAAPL